ncbi:MAG: DUF2007 domain-containing protein [Planctomycetes bacterium]|nr:DUF2007 domain-containing protein [Planctomycetota bacterium]
MLQSDDLVEVFSTSDATEAELLRGALHGEGIKCEVDGESQAGLVGLGMMKIKLLVRAIDHDRARSYIEKHQARQPPQP